MKKRRKPFAGLIVVSVVLAVTVLYLGIGFYYGENFYPGTYVNHVYCTGKTIEEISMELEMLYYESCCAEGIFCIQDSYGKKYEIPLAGVQFEVDYESQLEELKKKQNPLLWIQGLFRTEEDTLVPKISFEEDLLCEAIMQSGICETNRLSDSKEAFVVEIRKEEGYVLFDGRQHVLEMEKVLKQAGEALAQGVFYMDAMSCYTDLPYTEEMQDILSVWDKVNAFQHCGIVYDMGDEQVVLTPEIVCEFIALKEDGGFLFDEAGNLVLEESAVTAFVDALCERYNTFESVRTFQATRGELITIEGGTYGNVIDRDAEISYLTEALEEREGGVHIPAYTKEAYHRGADDIGDTYIEVDMTEQKLYYYEAGELLLETDIVTGNLRRGWDTPAGVNYVYAMQKNRTLRGATYASFVKYWVPVVGNIGIHDAAWRKEFGGDIYETGGSHGCINVPRETMGELYEMLEIGVPVVMFY